MGLFLVFVGWVNQTLSIVILNLGAGPSEHFLSYLWKWKSFFILNIENLNTITSYIFVSQKFFFFNFNNYLVMMSKYLTCQKINYHVKIFNLSKDVNDQKKF